MMDNNSEQPTYSSFEEYSIAREEARLKKLSRAIAAETTSNPPSSGISEKKITDQSTLLISTPQDALFTSLESLEQPTLTLAEQLHEDGLIALSQGDFQRAIRLFSQAITADPDLVKAYNNRGIARGELDLNQEALDDFNQALNLDSQLASAYYGRGTIYHKLGKTQQAYDDLSQAIALAPRWIDPYINRGLILTNSGSRSDALNDFNQALALDPNNIVALINRSGLYVRTGNYEGALADTNLILSLDPNIATAYNNRGIAHAGLGNNVQAKQDLQTAVNLFTQKGDTTGLTRAQKFFKTLFG